MRVLHVIDGLGPGGAERSLMEMLPGLADRGVESEVVIFNNSEFGAEGEVAASGTRVHPLTDRNKLAKIRGIRQLIRSRRPDIVWTTLYDSSVLSRLAAIGTGVPVVTSLVNVGYRESRNDPSVRTWKLEAARRLDGLTARRFGHRFHAITAAVKMNGVDTLGIAPELITVIPRGRSRERLGNPSPERRSQARKSLEIADHQLMVLSVGRREYQKGHSTLVKATALLVDRGLDVAVVIAGRDGRESTRLTALTEELGLEEIVRFLGQSDHVPELLAAADVFVFPSRFEGLGGSVLEAMGMGVPVVAADIAALDEVLAGGALGLLADVDNPAAFASAIAQVADDPSAAAGRAAAALAEFEGKYRLDKVLDDMVAWLDVCIGAVQRHAGTEPVR